MIINKGLIFTLLCLGLMNNSISRSDEASADYLNFSINDTCDYVTTCVQDSYGPLVELSDLDSDITEEQFFKLIDDVLIELHTLDPELRIMVFCFLVEMVIIRAKNMDFKKHSFIASF